MIPHINDLLNRWADWVAAGRKVSGLGYPSRAAFMRLTPSGGVHQAAMDEEAHKTDRAVIALGVQHPELHKTVMLFHLRSRSMTAEQMAKECGIGSRAFFYRVHSAHDKVLGYLNDIEADIPLPMQTVEKVA